MSSSQHKNCFNDVEVNMWQSEGRGFVQLMIKMACLGEEILTEIMHPVLCGLSSSINVNSNVCSGQSGHPACVYSQLEQWPYVMVKCMFS